ncbi:phytanoyl-CoA dioxygenase family protein [Micromonospora aurantiaca (nom. illeg.)]|uniref:phytanoyl-CoA dioxygenase family protein n=1 Tax=Micromonospora aurantiaca (nom. illeg.) TaxID=47850 RepID=UPI0033F43295
MGHPPDTTTQAPASPLGEAGFQSGIVWATPSEAAAIASRLPRDRVTATPHRVLPEINAVVRRTAIVNAVADLIGPDIAIEGGFLIVKNPGDEFTVPWHQDGTNGRGELDPARSVTLWAALTDASVDAGALHVIPGSWRYGYLPCHREDGQGGRARGLTTTVPVDAGDPVVVPVAAGQALLMDQRLLHSSPPNTTAVARIGLNVRFVAPGALRPRAGQPRHELTPVAGAGW